MHGRVVLTDAPAFPEERRLDQPAVRAYRAGLASPKRRGFGLGLLDGDADAFLVEDSLPLAVHDRDDARIEALTFAPRGRPGAVQVVRVAARDEELEVSIGWDGDVRLARAEYTQLTPGGPLPPVAEEPISGVDGRVLWIEDRGLGAAAAIALPASVVVPAGTSVPLIVALAVGISLRDVVREATSLAGEGLELVEQEVGERRRWWQGVGLAGPSGGTAGPSGSAGADPDHTTRRGIAYVLDCAAAEVPDPRDGTAPSASPAVAMLADHEILPLVWTRDAYYCCRALLALAGRDQALPGGDGDAVGDGRAVGDERALSIVLRFLEWLFVVAERPAGWWPRASLASGAAKDPAFQLDQQLFPLLLLDDVVRLAKDPLTARRYAVTRDGVVAALLAKRSASGLIATDETPADDPLEQPYHFSSHVLLWRVLREVDPRAAEEVRAATRKAFMRDGRFAYAVGGPPEAGISGRTGGRARSRARRQPGRVADPAHASVVGAERDVRFYHDANDFPTVFAPGWGFCSADDPVWRATIEFAWSRENGSYFEGELAGLGSLHTRHPWPLGDLQKIVVARVLRDPAREQRAWERLERVQTWDALLPEAYDEATGAVASRHWFAWPSALRALLWLDRGLTAP